MKSYSRRFPSPPTRVAALLSGDVDFIMPVPPADLDRIEKTSGLKLVTMSGSRIITFQLNQKRRAEFANPKVRQGHGLRLQ